MAATSGHAAASRSVEAYFAALEARHLAPYRTQEITRALRALSMRYVQRRGSLNEGGALGSAGKRASFALFYGPLHFVTVHHITAALGAAGAPLASIVDLGCGTGVAGAALAVAAAPSPTVLGIDRHPWALAEARWTYTQLAIDGTTRQGDVARVRLPGANHAIVAAYTVNELPDAARAALLGHLQDAVARGARLLIVEPIATSVSPWWHEWRERLAPLGARADEWTLIPQLPAWWHLLDRAAGFARREVKARSLFVQGQR